MRTMIIARTRIRGLLILAAAVTLSAWGAVVATPSDAQTTDVGLAGPSYSGVSAPTGQKPESKLWFNDGRWWSSMFDTASGSWHIFFLNRSASPEKWVDSGTQLDDRAGTLADTLWTGGKLYVASHVTATSNAAAHADRPARLFRYSYDPQTAKYTLDSGFPTNINNVSSETLTIDMDGSGRLWATWTQQQAVYVTSSSTGAQWDTPSVLPVDNANGIDPDDISTIVAFKGRIGVMWSSQSNSKVYFSFRNNTDGLATWRPSVSVTVPGSDQADDHLNIKELQADPDGRIFAVIKTSLDHYGASAPQIVVLARSATGGWSRATFGTVADCHTRPILMLDSTNNLVHVFATAPDSGCPFTGTAGTVFEKTSPMSSLAFASGRGTPVMRDAASENLNNVSGSKQTVNAGTGLVLLASNDVTKTYWSADESLGAPSSNLNASFNGSPVSGTSPLPVTFSDTSTGDPVAWSWDFGDGSTSTEENPSHTYANAGTYTVELTVTDAAGQTDSTTRSNYISASAPAASISGVAATTTYSGTPQAQVGLSRPSGTTAGDVLIASITADENPGMTAVPTGWTAMVNGLSINASSSSGARVFTYYHMIGANDPSSYSWTLSAAHKWGAGVSAYRGVDKTTPLDSAVVTTTDTSYTSKKLILPGVTTSDDGAQLIGGVGLDSGTPSQVSPPSGWTERWEAGGGQISELSDHSQDTAGSSGPVVWTLSAARALGGWLAALRPAR